MEAVYTVPEVAAYLKLSKSKVYGMVRRGEIPHQKFGKNVRIMETDLVKWMEVNRNEKRNV